MQIEVHLFQMFYMPSKDGTKLLGMGGSGRAKEHHILTSVRKWNTLINTPLKDVRYEVQLVPGRPLSKSFGSLCENQN